MQIINRTMKSTVTETDKDKYMNSKCQASLNSDGSLTIRTYIQDVKDADEIIVFSGKETDAVFRLIRKLCFAVQTMTDRQTDLPF